VMSFVPSKPIPIPPPRANAHTADLMLDCVDPGGVYIRPGRPGPSSTNGPPQTQRLVLPAKAHHPPVPLASRIALTQADPLRKQPVPSKLLLKRKGTISAQNTLSPSLSKPRSRTLANDPRRRSSTIGADRPTRFVPIPKMTTMKAGSSKSLIQRSKLSIVTTPVVTWNHEENPRIVSPPRTLAKHPNDNKSPTSANVISGSSSSFSALSLLQDEPALTPLSSPDIASSKVRRSYISSSSNTRSIFASQLSSRRQRVVIRGFEPKSPDHESWYMITRLKPPLLPPRPHHISVVDLPHVSLRGWTPGSSESELMERWENVVDERWREARWKAYRESLVCPGSERCKRMGVSKAELCQQVVLGKLNAGVNETGLDAWRERCSGSKGMGPVLYPAIVEMRFGPRAWRPRRTTDNSLWNTNSCAVFWDSVSNVREFLRASF
jgi:hypothetical protein